ncbi:MAG: PD-(D/E)XK nuclease family protein [Verrucomicrobia bacterium]|nr:PD-(D/E)XK nuclease family protein [Verrucomicrobiota bacterium]
MRSLQLTGDLASVWQEEIAPWCLAATGHLCASGAESWLVCGSRGQADWARDQLLARGGGLLGLRFLSPFAFRARLADALGVPIETTGREVLDFAVRSRAAAHDELNIATDPGGWLEALQEADAAGLLEVPSFRDRLVPRVLGQFIDLLRDDASWLPGVDRRIAAAAEVHPRGRVRLGLLGLDERQATLLPLIRAAAAWAGELRLWLPQPRLVAENAGIAWIETLERVLGVEHEILPHLSEGPNAALVEHLERATSDAALTRPEVLTGLRGSDEVELAAEFAGRWLASGATGRCAFVFPKAGGGSVLLSRRLQELRLRHEDRLGERPEPSANVRLLRALAAYHREGQSAPALLRLLGVQRGQDDPAGQLELETALQRRFVEVQIARAEVCAQRTPVAGLVKALGRWPERGPVSAFRDCWNAGAEAVGAGMWELEAFWDGIAKWVPESREVEGRAVLGALESALLAVPSQFARNPRHVPHARLVLTSLREAAGQTWDAVVLMHSVESVWPQATPPARFLTEKLRREWNARGGLRLREGHDAIGADEADWLDLLAQCRGPVVFAGRQRSAEAERGEQPNAWLVRALSACAVPEPVKFWEHSTQIRELPGETFAAQEELRRIHADRRDPNTGFDRFSFNYSTASPLPALIFRPSALDELLQHPGQAALRQLFAAEARRDLDAAFARSFPQALGSLVHKWVSRTLNEAGQSNAPLTRAALEELLGEPILNHGSLLAAQLLSRLGRPVEGELPRWWRTLHAEAEGFVRLFLEGLAGSDFVDQGWAFATEQDIENTQPPRLRGRMDLALRRGPNVVVIDFKTGRNLHTPRSDRGAGLELVGYAWCLMEQTSGELALGLAGKTSAVPVPNFTRAKLAEFEPWRKRLADLQREGCYGWAGPLQSSPNANNAEVLPLTTPPVPAWVLKKKAEHSGLHIARGLDDL